MKKIIIGVLILIAYNCNAQIASFRQFNEPYAYLQNANTPFESYKWDDLFSFEINFSVPIGFDSILGTNLLIQGDGSASISTPFDPEDGHFGLIPFAYYYQDKSIKLNLPKPVSPISYLFDEINGETVLKVQWKNVGFQYGSPNDSANFQFWLFANSQKVQFRYGESYVSNLDSILTIDTMQIGVAVYTSVLDKGTYLVGSPNNISLSNDGFATFHGIPPAGTVYEFSSLSLGLSNKYKSSINYKINDDELILLSDFGNDSKMELVDLIGNTVATSNSKSISIQLLNTGVYILKITTDKNIFTQKIFISR